MLPPATGWKLARWQRAGGGIAFAGVSGGGTYGVLDESRCLHGCPDGVPASEHHPCGFYALKRRSRSPRMPAGVVELRVGLAGLVREYQYGYRAGWQRVLESGEYGTLAELAAAEGISRSYVCRVLRLTLLALGFALGIAIGKYQPEPIVWPWLAVAATLRSGPAYTATPGTFIRVSAMSS
jgi:hypothetical protein